MGDRVIEVAGRDLVRGATTAAGEVERALLALVRRRLTEQPDVDHARVGVRRVVRVAGEVLGADLPVAGDAPPLWTTHLDAGLALVDVEIEEEPEVAERILERHRRRDRGWRTRDRGTYATCGGDSNECAALSNPAAPPYASSWNGTPTSRPSLRYVHAWYGHRKCDALPVSARQTCMPLWRHTLSSTWISPVSIARHDERVVDDPAHDVVARVGDLGLVGEELPGAWEQPLALEGEDGRIAVDRCRDPAGVDVGDHLCELHCPCTPSPGSRVAEGRRRVAG